MMIVMPITKIFIINKVWKKNIKFCSKKDFSTTNNKIS